MSSTKKVDIQKLFTVIMQKRDQPQTVLDILDQNVDKKLSADELYEVYVELVNQRVFPAASYFLALLTSKDIKVGEMLDFIREYIIQIGREDQRTWPAFAFFSKQLSTLCKFYFTKKGDNQAKQTVFLLQTVCRILKGAHPGFINYAHVCFIEQCVRTRFYEVGYEFATQTVFGPEEGEDVVDPIEMQKYFYYSGVICATLRDYTCAYQLLKLGIIIPTGPANALQLAIFKKYLLISVILYRKPPEEITLVPYRVVEQLQRFVPLYKDLELIMRGIQEQSQQQQQQQQLSSSSQSDPTLQSQGSDTITLQKFQRLIHSRDKENELRIDNLWGLAKQGEYALRDYQFVKTIETFGTMNISQIQKQWELGPHSAINEIFRLVEKYGVDATIDQAKGTVSFRSKESGSGTSIYHVAQREKEIALSVADEMKNLTNISAQMQSLFDQIQVSSRALNQIDSESGKDGM